MDFNMAAFVLMLFCYFDAGRSMWVKEMENNGAFEGDMVLDPDEFERGWNVSKSKYASIKGGRWPGAVVPYQIERSIGAQGVSAINQAIADYHRYTCIRFVRRTNQRSYVSFYRGGGCSSPVGYRNGRVNRISLASGCWQKGVTMHEMGHTLGFYHEQSRPDRDQHVRIIWGNIPQRVAFNFNKQTTLMVDSLGTPYDYSSMMHYGSRAFGNGRTTIQTIDPSKQNLIGNRRGFSAIDIQQLKLMYNCGKTKPKPRPNPKPTSRPTSSCTDRNRYCRSWAQRGYCSKRKSYMKINCCRSCKTVGSGSGSGGRCVDKNRYCAYQASRGYCRSSRYGAWMMKNCRRSCRRC